MNDEELVLNILRLKAKKIVEKCVQEAIDNRDRWQQTNELHVCSGIREAIDQIKAEGFLPDTVGLNVGFKFDANREVTLEISLHPLDDVEDTFPSSLEIT
jgi:hypothetical protein